MKKEEANEIEPLEKEDKCQNTDVLSQMSSIKLKSEFQKVDNHENNQSFEQNWKNTALSRWKSFWLYFQR